MLIFYGRTVLAACLAFVALSCSGQANDYGIARADFNRFPIDQRYEMQALLGVAGYWPAVANDQFNHRLFEAIGQFQAANGFPASGILTSDQIDRMRQIANPILSYWQLKLVRHPITGLPLWVPLGVGFNQIRTRSGLDFETANKIAAISLTTSRRHPRKIEVTKTEEVRNFYERMPYPAPLTSLDERRDLYKNPDRRRAMFHLMWPADQPRGNQEILIAGCGTSQAASYAVREPDARITAIDISDASLRHTRDLQRKYNLKNLELHQLPIESVREIGRSFDLVVCTGVLHHLTDPDNGLCALRDVLRPSGAMRLMVYARYGRAGIYMMQEYCRLLRISASARDLRDLGAAIEALPADHPITGVLRRAKDFRRPEAMADALLHPQDRAYTVPELYAWLDLCGISFGRWIEQAPYLAQCGSVARSPHAARLASLPSRLQHAAVELYRGTMVSHDFIAYREDRSDASPPINFAGDRWRDYCHGLCAFGNVCLLVASRC
jgi:SAM-dependent methyltransferase